MKIEITINGSPYVLLIRDEYADRVPNNFILPKGTRMVIGKEKGTGRDMVCIHSEDLESLFPRQQ